MQANVVLSTWLKRAFTQAVITHQLFSYSLLDSAAGLPAPCSTVCSMSSVTVVSEQWPKQSETGLCDRTQLGFFFCRPKAVL